MVDVLHKDKVKIYRVFVTEICEHIPCHFCPKGQKIGTIGNCGDVK